MRISRIWLNVKKTLTKHSLTTVTQREITKEASQLLQTINQGVVNIPKIKNFLSRLGAEQVPGGRKASQKERAAKYASMK